MRGDMYLASLRHAGCLRLSTQIATNAGEAITQDPEEKVEANAKTESTTAPSAPASHPQNVASSPAVHDSSMKSVPPSVTPQALYDCSSILTLNQ